MNPVVERTEALLLAGISGILPPRNAPPPARPAAIRQLWQSLLSRAAEITARIGDDRYSVVANDVRENGKPPLMRTLVRVSTFENLPTWCEHYTVEPGFFAQFVHVGPPQEMARTVAEIHRNWGGKIPGLFESDVEIMHMPAGYDPTRPDARFAYWLPLP